MGMLQADSVGLVAGAVALGALHGVEPGHGWPVAASYALDRAHTWLYGLAASVIIGVGHLVSSIAMVAAFFYAKSYFDLTQVNDPLTVLGGLRIGGPVSVVAGLLLIALGIREYRHGHAHGDEHGHAHGDEHGHAHGDEHGHAHGDEHGHAHGDGHGHAHGDEHGYAQEHENGQAHGDEQMKADVDDHDHATNEPGRLTRIGERLPFVGGHGHARDVPHRADDRGLLGIAWFAFVLGFAHEEEFEIIALCAGSAYCLELMLAYALTVILGIVGLTLLLIAGYEHAEATVEAYTPYLPLFSASVLVLLGVGFILGLL